MQRVLGRCAFACALCANTTIAQVSLGRVEFSAHAPRATVTPGQSPLGLANERDGFLYVPRDNKAARPEPLLILLHGATQASRIFERVGPAAESLGVVILAPDSRGMTWDAVRDDFGPDVAFLDRAIMAAFDRAYVDPCRVVIGGFSDGASYALSLALRSSAFQGAVAFSPGFIIPSRDSAHLPLFIRHGTADRILPIGATSRPIVAGLKRSGFAVDYAEFDGPHTVRPADVQAALQWVKQRSCGTPHERPQISAHVLATLPRSGLVIEAVGYDARTRTYLLTSINERTLLGFRRDSLWRVVSGPGMLLGLHVDRASRTAWACSTVSTLLKEFAAPGEAEHSEIIGVDLDRPTITHRIAFPPSQRSRFCDSVVGDAEGNLYVTDGGTNAICIVPRGADRMSRCIEAPPRTFPQGVVPLSSTDLLVAGYGVGIQRLDVRTGVWRAVPAGGFDLRGIDGLTGYRGCVIGIQNGAKPARVLVMHLTRDRDAIDRVSVIDAPVAQLDEPTWGTVVGRRFVFIANSQNETARTKGVKALRPPVLMEFTIPADC